MKFKLNIIIIFLAWLVIGCQCTPKTADVPERYTHISQLPSTLTILNDLSAQEKLLLTMAQSYPEKITDVAFMNDDWTMLVGDTRFYFANGRFLPEKLREKWENYLPYDFYVYPWLGTDERRQFAYQNPVYSVGSSFLFDTMYGSATEDDSWELQEKYVFLGVKLLIHRDIIPALDKVAAQVLAASKKDSSIRRWLAELQTGVSNYGWSWRPIASTNRRSNHSYGIAIDFLPVDLRGRKTYWRWNSDVGKTKIEYYQPPKAVIAAFEENGFVWGGKWDLIDTMHFEYRPEILLLNDFPVTLTPQTQPQ